MDSAQISKIRYPARERGAMGQAIENSIVEGNYLEKTRWTLNQEISVTERDIGMQHLLLRRLP